MHKSFSTYILKVSGGKDEEGYFFNYCFFDYCSKCRRETYSKFSGTLFSSRERDAFDGNLCEDWEEIASNFWNSCQETGCPVTYSDYRKLAYRFGHCDFEKMEKDAREKGFSSVAEYEEAEFEKIMNN